MNGEDQRRGRWSVWRQRGRRTAIGVNVLLSVLLAAAVLGMLNYLAWKYLNLRGDVSSTRYYALSGKTLSLIQSLKGNIRVVVFFRNSHPLYDDIKRLLKSYAIEASGVQPLNLAVEFVDPDRDLARARELARDYDVAEADCVIFSTDGRRKCVAAKDMAEYDMSLEGRRVVKRLKAFVAEQAFSSALLSVTQTATPVVYFLVGHGERDVTDTNEKSGYSRILRAILRDNAEVRPLLLAGGRGIPDDCSAIVIAGPSRMLSETELDLLAGYLSRSGRLLALLDSGRNIGLENLLERWGVRLAPDLAVGLTLTGRELVVMQYGRHPITRRLSNVATMFYQPRSVEPFEAGLAADRTDKPTVTVLASTPKEGWAEMDLSDARPRFDPAVDRAGPIAVAVAVERGARGGIRVELPPTRLVVAGDSQFVSNGALSAGMGGNEDFFMNALNWLLEREALLAVAPKLPGELRLDLDQRGIRLAFAVVVLAAPALATVMGFLVWLRRRQ